MPNKPAKNQNAQQQQSNQSNKKSNPRRNTRRRYRPRRFYRTRAPAAFGGVISPFQRQYTTRSGAVHLTSAEVFAVTAVNGEILCCSLPFTPSKWRDTRTCAIVSTYASFRPLRVKITWQPSLGTNTAGSITFGTVFAGTSIAYNTNDDAMASLLTTNGGFQTTIWQPTSRVIRLATHLRANSFPTNTLSSDDIPFWILASCTSSLPAGVLGYLVVTSTISLTNPIANIPYVLPAAPVQGQFTHTDNPAKTVLEVPIPQGNNLAVGQEVWFAPTKNIVNTTGQTVNGILRPFVGTLAAVLQAALQFDVDSNFATQASKLVFGGRPENF